MQKEEFIPNFDAFREDSTEEEMLREIDRALTHVTGEPFDSQAIKESLARLRWAEMVAGERLDGGRGPAALEPVEKAYLGELIDSTTHRRLTEAYLRHELDAQGIELALAAALEREA